MCQSDLGQGTELHIGRMDWVNIKKQFQWRQMRLKSATQVYFSLCERHVLFYWALSKFVFNINNHYSNHLAEQLMRLLEFQEILTVHPHNTWTPCWRENWTAAPTDDVDTWYMWERLLQNHLRATTQMSFGELTFKTFTTLQKLF